MNIEINAIDLLTKNQKKELGDAIFDRITWALDELKIEPIKIDLNWHIKDAINNIFEDGSLWDNCNFKAIAKEINNIVITHLKEAQK